MSRRILRSAVLGLAVLAAGCASQPTSPTGRVLPAPNKPFQVFQEEDGYCRNYASSQVAGDADKANNDTLLDAGIGTILGAGLGAAVGGGVPAVRGAAAGGDAAAVDP